MAIGTAIKSQNRPVSKDGYVSDDSSFYGDTPTKQDLNNRAASFSAAACWSQSIISPTAMALANMPTSVAQPKLHNPYEGSVCARQLGEAVDEFLKRLPPLTTTQCEKIPWIFIANPYRDGPSILEGGETAGQWAGFVNCGGRLLLGLRTFQAELNRREAKGKVKLYNDQREKVVRELRDVAVEHRCTSGKWMLFVEPEEINTVWGVVARATANNELGHAAKVAPDAGGGQNQRLVCIYTSDFTDMEDVTRVAQKMKDIGLIEARKAIYYKCDAYTYLGLNRDNEWGIKTSLFSSKDVLTNSAQTKISAFLQKKKNAVDDRTDRMDWE